MMDNLGIEPQDDADSVEASQSSTKSTIKRIDKGTVHNICSGQVITSLRSAVKELVENALDAGATSVEIHLCDHGATSIEVIDNGSGILAEDFEAVGLKHHTSKLREFDDLPGVDTFGFRGEALGSLCALAEVAMVTRHRSAPVATRLQFDANGRISEQTPAARQVGTTVMVRQLFSPLPVRRRQFCDRARREVNDLLQLLWGYALVVDGVRLMCTQQVSSGKRSVLLSSPAAAALADRVTALFGQKQTAALLPLRPVSLSEQTRDEFGLNAVKEQSMPRVTVEGLVSSCEHGKGRSATDRQFVAINGRPCDHTKICRLANEVYRNYNRHQSPFLALSLTLAREQVDVNVTPDKRMLFVQNEKYLLACVKESLTQCFESLPSSYRVTPLASAGLSSPNSAPPMTSQSARVTSSSPSGPSGDWISAIKRSAKKTPQSTAAADDLSNKRQCLDRFFRRAPPPEEADGGGSLGTPPASGDTNGTGGGSPGELPPQTPDRLTMPTAASDAAENCRVSGADDVDDPSDPGVDGDVVIVESPVINRGVAVDSRHGAAWTHNGLSVREGPVVAAGVRATVEEGYSRLNGENRLPTLEGAGSEDQECSGGVEFAVDRTDSGVGGLESAPTEERETPDVTIISHSPTSVAADPETSVSPSPSQNSPSTVELSQDGDSDVKPVRRRARLLFSMTELRRQVEELETSTAAAAGRDGDGDREWRFRAGIKPSDNTAAEQELSRQITKEDFLKMRIIGQFNLGFLVTQLGQDLFLIDQHATDEKYNFERLSRQPLGKQPLVVPQELELPPASEETILAHPEAFTAAGFHVTEDPEAPPGRRLRLMAAPAVQGVVCGKSDLEELIWLVHESPGPLAALRPSRVRAVLASRACRTSVMIGTALAPAGMTRLVQHMAEMDHPWNCPHGRPTMRHLVCLSMLENLRSGDTDEVQ